MPESELHRQYRTGTLPPSSFFAMNNLESRRCFNPPLNLLLIELVNLIHGDEGSAIDMLGLQKAARHAIDLVKRAEVSHLPLSTERMK